MISKAKVKFIKSLQLKKYRKEEQSFIVEGSKGVEELLRSSFEVQWVAATASFLHRYEENLVKRQIEFVEANEKELSTMGTFLTNEGALAIATTKQNASSEIRTEFALVLDDIRDPGNLGTIIRTADWYGIKSIIASKETADFYNPKVINASMGSFCRVNVYYTDLVQYLTDVSLPIFGAFLNGSNVHTTDFGKSGFIVVGNEAQGISPAIQSLVKIPITIAKRGGAESLNASIATAIILDNVFRLQE